MTFDDDLALSAAVAGLLAGLSGAAMALIRHEEGVSGVTAGLLRGAREGLGPRLGFILGLALMGGVLFWAAPGRFVDTSGRPSAAFLAGGLLVGLGARIANGCTSGHGLLGVSRGSRRSVAALALFGLAATVTVALFPALVLR